MNKIIIISILSILAFTNRSFSQPYVVNEKVEKVFSESFTDINDNFERTPSSNQKFWGKYADGYYYMERKISSPRAIVVKTEEVSKNFSIKTKLTLGPVGGLDASVGIMFLVQSSGRGGFIFEINKKKSFRITDLGTSAYITKEGKNGWVKSKIIAPAGRSNTIELKSFRGKFDIYINGLYLHSFVNDSYQKGKFGVYIGPNSAASLYYFNVYNLDIPSAEPEINVDDLQAQIESLKNENDSLKTIAIKAKYGGSDDAAISAIKILENQLQTINEENLHLKNILSDYEKSEPNLNPEEIEKDQTQTTFLAEKITRLSSERDSVIESIGPLKDRILKTNFQRDSLRDINLKLEKKIAFLEEHIQEVQVKIDEIKVKKENPTEVVLDTNIPAKEPSKPSEFAEAPKMMNNLPMSSTAPPLELVEKDSTYDHTLDMDEAFGIEDTKLGEEVIDSVNVLINDSLIGLVKTEPDTIREKITEGIETTKDTLITLEPDSIELIETEKKIELTPISELKIEVKKAIKGDFKE